MLQSGSESISCCCFFLFFFENYKNITLSMLLCLVKLSLFKLQLNRQNIVDVTGQSQPNMKQNSMLFLKFKWTSVMVECFEVKTDFVPVPVYFNVFTFSINRNLLMIRCYHFNRFLGGWSIWTGSAVR